MKSLKNQYPIHARATRALPPFEAYPICCRLSGERERERERRLERRGHHLSAEDSDHDDVSEHEQGGGEELVASNPPPPVIRFCRPRALDVVRRRWKHQSGTPESGRVVKGARCRCRRRCRLLCRVRDGLWNDVACCRVHSVLGHPLEVRLVHLRPFDSKAGPAVTGPDRPRVARSTSDATARASLHARSAARRVPPPRPRRQVASLRLRRADAARRHLVAGHERQEPNQDRRDAPGRVEGFWVEVADAEAKPGRRLEPPARRVHADGRRRVRVVGREEQRAPILTAMVGRLRRTGDDVVPSTERS